MNCEESRMIALRCLIAICCVALLPALAGRDAWPQAARTIRIIVPYAAGGAPDILARLAGDEISRAHGPTVVVENRPGAGSVVGSEAVARSAPDGNTLLITANAFVINPHLHKVNYDPLTSFEPVCHLVSVPTFIVVNAASPYHTLADLLDAARARPGELTLASPGPGTTFHIALEMLKRAANVNITYVPYPATPPALNALLGEHVTSVFSDYASLVQQFKAGKVRALATAARTRVAALPDVPTVAESGFKDYEAETWFGVVAPAHTPKATTDELAGWFSAALQAPEVKPKLALQVLSPSGKCGADFADFLRKQYDDYGRVIAEANIKAE
jgi:tripartite-type tricarboxylate transporter receptor subunit TctC